MIIDPNNKLAQRWASANSQSGRTKGQDHSAQPPVIVQRVFQHIVVEPDPEVMTSVLKLLAKVKSSLKSSSSQQRLPFNHKLQAIKNTSWVVLQFHSDLRFFLEVSVLGIPQ